jgi:hypothetical protein
MIRNVYFIQNGISETLTFEEKKFTVVLDPLDTLLKKATSFDLCFELHKPIAKVRNHAYEWEDLTGDFIANEFHPKIVQLVDGIFLQSNITSGFWEIKKKNPRFLLWRFNPENANTLTEYIGTKNTKVGVMANQSFDFKVLPALLWSTTNAIEFSRSKIPFSAVACFTDHCDFDTPNNTSVQRVFFTSRGIKITKGFFLNHFSKRTDNLSYEREASELLAWKADGHELAYHSLSQSLKSNEDSLTDFYQFQPPQKDILTWIDHGFQSYNLSLYKNSGMNDTIFSTTMHKNGITTFWNYIDSGIATLGVINQLNPQDFTLHSYYKGINTNKWSERMGMMLKTILFHYYADEDLIEHYKQLASFFKQLVYDKNLKAVVKFFKSFVKILFPLLKVIFNWNKVKKIPFKYAKYSPVVFKHTIDKIPFFVFQTIEMNDFIAALHPKNCNKLIEESGLFIAHTYLSLPLTYHNGRFLNNETKINPTVKSNFEYLASKIKEDKIWNPTLDELIAYLANFDNTVLDSNDNGLIYVVNPSGLVYRTIQ